VGISITHISAFAKTIRHADRHRHPAHQPLNGGAGGSSYAFFKEDLNGGGGGDGAVGGGGGGGSFLSDLITDQVKAGGVNSGDGSISITSLTPAVPEPSTWAMMATGFAGLAGWRGSVSGDQRAREAHHASPARACDLTVAAKTELLPRR
jgi:PEP-CTERM motif